MALIKSFNSIHPTISSDVFVAENATIIGDVTIGKESSIWYNAVLRGDAVPIRVGDRTNIQDGAIIHGTTHRNATVIGSDVTIGHTAIIHGCTIEDEVLIGMSAVILDDAHVPKHTVVAAKALVLEGTKLESGFLYAGIPAKKIKPLSSAQISMLKMSALHYVENGKLHDAKTE